MRLPEVHGRRQEFLAGLCLAPSAVLWLVQFPHVSQPNSYRYYKLTCRGYEIWAEARASLTSRLCALCFERAGGLDRYLVFAHYREEVFDLASRQRLDLNVASCSDRVRD